MLGPCGPSLERSRGDRLDHGRCGRLQRQSMRVIAEARSDLAMLRPKAAILDAADELLEAVGSFVAVATAGSTPTEREVSESIERVSAARRTLLDAAATKTRRRT